MEEGTPKLRSNSGGLVAEAVWILEEEVSVVKGLLEWIGLEATLELEDRLVGGVPAPPVREEVEALVDPVVLASVLDVELG